MDDRQLIEDLLSALEYHIEQTRPIQFSTVAIEAAREHLRKPAQRKPLTDEDCTRIYNEANGITTKNPPITTERIFKAMRAAHGIKENT